MNGLINVSTNEQGSQVVSARELHEFLGSKKQFADWIKNRLDKYGLIENQDYTTFSLIGEKGRPSIEYALTIDAAKELAMVEGNAKGKEARQYFIDCEKRLKQKTETLPATQDELILMLAQRNVDTARRVSVLEQKIERIEQIQHQAEVELLALPAPSEPMVDMTPEAQIVRQVNTFSRARSIGQQEVWRLVYQELYYRYRISVGSYKLDKGETKLQRLKKLGHIDKVLVVATNILRVDGTAA